MPAQEMDRPIGGHYWCDGHHAVETFDNVDEDRLPGCFLQGPFDTWHEARMFGVHRDPDERETAKTEAARSSWNDLLSDIPGL